MTKLFFLALCGAAMLAQGNCHHLEALRNLTSDASRRVEEVVHFIKRAPNEFGNMTSERVECLLWECTVQEKATNETTLEAVNKGMLKNKQANNFYCIGQASKDTVDKLNAMGTKILGVSEEIRDKGLRVVREIEVLMHRFGEYVPMFERKKTAEIMKACGDEAKEAVLEEARDKMKLLHTVLNDMEERITKAKFKFLEDHINFAYQMDNTLRKIHKDGAQKIMKCVS